MNSIVRKKVRGFTLIEILLVIAIIAILAAIAIIAINPAKQLADARNAQRRNDVYAILNAVHQYAVDNDGEYPEVLDTVSREICKTDNVSCNDMYELTVLTDDQEYLTAMPIDPLCQFNGTGCIEGGTGYEITITDGGRITVLSSGAELDEVITITR